MVRFKNRWLLVEIMFSETGPNGQPKAFNSKQIHNAIKQSVVTNFGDVGWGSVAASLTIKYFSPMTNICIIRVARDHHRIAWGAITLLTSIDGQKILPFVVHCSGTIKHVQHAAIQHNREIIARFRAKAKDAAAPPRPAGVRSGWISTAATYDNYLEQSTQEINALQD